MRTQTETESTDLTSAITDYVARCDVHLRDVPAPAREQLRRDIEEIVSEVCGELDGAPDDLVGTPARFVHELRVSAGYPPPPLEAHPPRVGGRRRRVLRGALRRVWAHPATAWTRRFAPELRPAWWVLRGALVVTATAWITGASHRPHWLFGLVPYWPILGSRLLGVVGLCAGVYLSVEASRRPLTRPLRLLRLGASVVAVLFGLTMMSQVREWTRPVDFTLHAPGQSTYVPPPHPATAFTAVQVGSDLTGESMAVVNLTDARASVDQLLAVSPPAAIYIESGGERQYPQTRAGINELLDDLVARGHLNEESPPAD